MKTGEIPIASLRRDGGTQIRAALDEDTVAEYAAVIREGGAMPPVLVVHDGKNHWVVDGFHRVEAALRAGKTRQIVEVAFGTLEQAILEACGANQRHGLRRSTADKRRAVETMLAHPVAKDWSLRRIADHIGVSHEMVATHRSKVSENDASKVTSDSENEDLRRETPKGQPGEGSNAGGIERSPTPDDEGAGDGCITVHDQVPAPGEPPIDMLGLTAPADWLEGVAVVRAALVKLDSTMRTMQVLASVLPKGLAQRLTAKLQECGALARGMVPAVACKACRAKGCAVCDKRGWLTVEATKSMHPDALVA